MGAILGGITNMDELQKQEVHVTYIRYHGQIKSGGHASFVDASFLGANVGGHLLSPKGRRLPDADHLLAVSLRHYKL